MRTPLLHAWVGLCLSTAGCDEKTNPSESVDLTGTFRGYYTVDFMEDARYDAVLRLVQTGDSARGTLTTDVGRSADMVGWVSGTTYEATLTFTDLCKGDASVVLEAFNNASRLKGTYSASDCLGEYSGDFVLDKR